MRNPTITSATFLSLISALALASACAKDQEEPDEAGDFGSECNVEEEGSCNEGLACIADESGDATCVIAPGEECDDSEDDDGCGPFGVCAVPTNTETAADSEGAGGAATEADGTAVCLVAEGGECDPESPHCDSDLTCAETIDGETRCFGRVVMRGMVNDTSDASAIGGAHVLALDEEGSALTDISVSEADGSYLLDIPALRNEDGSPVDANFTLNGSAQDYQPFPSGVRVALPIASGDAVQEDRLYVIDSALTDIGLIPLQEGDRVMASGNVSALGEESNVAGLLVVATSDGGTFTAVTDLSGNFTIFNLPDGDYEVRAYGAGVQVEPGTISVSGEAVEDVVLEELDMATTTVSGNIQIVDPGGAGGTSVILVVQDTFDELAARGEVPRGLRAPESGPVTIDGAFTIEGVPEGTYVVLAAYENDDLVRDPDTNIAGTSFVTIEVIADDATLDISDSFKVTGDLAIVGPGADRPEAVTEAPLLEWEADSSEDWYDVHVYDAFGDEVWQSLEILSVGGSGTVSVQYDGPLDPGMYYQFRVTSWRQPGNGEAAPISTSEDLRGVFYLPAD